MFVFSWLSKIRKKCDTCKSPRPGNTAIKDVRPHSTDYYSEILGTVKKSAAYIRFEGIAMAGQIHKKS